MIESVRNAFALPDLRRKILFTLFLMVIYRLVANIPVPGVDLQFWNALNEGSTAFGANNLLGVLNLLSDSATLAEYSVHARINQLAGYSLARIGNGGEFRRGRDQPQRCSSLDLPLRDLTQSDHATIHRRMAIT